MGGWTTWSECVRATSKNLFGPYKFEEVVLQKGDSTRWDKSRVHNVKILKIGSRYVLYYISTKMNTGYAYADKITGPWTRIDKPAMHITNPAILVKPDNSIYVVGRGEGPNKTNIATAFTAPSFDGTYTLLKEGNNVLPGDFELEDPTIWWANNQYNILVNDWKAKATGLSKGGAQYYSKDGLSYTLMDKEPVFTKTVEFDDHTTETFSRRERPFVYTNSKDEVIAFFTTCLPQNGPARIVIQPVDNYYPSNKTTVTAQSEWVFPGKDGKLNYKSTPAGDKIIDFSHAGYMGGGVKLPTVPVKKTVKPTGGKDDTELIQSAVNEVSAMPVINGFRGAILLEPGLFTCSGPITITADGVVLRGSGVEKNGTILKMTGDRHSAIVVGKGRNRDNSAETKSLPKLPETTLADKYVPSGVVSIAVADPKGFSVGDQIEIRKPVTKAWVHFMEMDNLTRDGKPQTWIKEGTTINTRRTITAIKGKIFTLDVPVTDSYVAKFSAPTGTVVVKVPPSGLTSQCGIENLHIQAPPMEVSHEQSPYNALRINGQDCWAKNLLIEETMNSVGANGFRITLEDVKVTRTVPNVGASKPAEFAPNAGQILLNRCSSYGDNIWHVGTGAQVAGPIVMLNCTFGGSGHIEGHQRWTTGILLDNCTIREGGIDLKNRGSMGSGHGWGSAWSVVWNCDAKSYVVQQPPGAYNWLIGSYGTNIPTARPFDQSPTLPLGVSDSPGVKVMPESLYLRQLEERLGKQALRNIGY
jgi:hypothetical protein